MLEDYSRGKYLGSDIQHHIHDHRGGSSIMRGANDIGILAHLVHHNVSHWGPVALELHADGPGQHLQSGLCSAIASSNRAAGTDTCRDGMAVCVSI